MTENKQYIPSVLKVMRYIRRYEPYMRAWENQIDDRTLVRFDWYKLYHHSRWAMREIKYCDIYGMLLDLRGYSDDEFPRVYMMFEIAIDRIIRENAKNNNLEKILLRYPPPIIDSGNVCGRGCAANNNGFCSRYNVILAEGSKPLWDKNISMRPEIIHVYFRSEECIKEFGA